MISRRSALSWLGVSAAGVGALNAFSAFAGTRAANGTRVLSLESFCVTDDTQVEHLRSYMTDALLPCMDQLGKGRRMCLEAIVAPHTPQTLLLAVYPSFNQMLEERASIAADPRVSRARAKIELPQVLHEVRSQVLVAGEESVRFPAGPASGGLVEVRTWHAPAWREGPPSNVSSILKRSGIHPIVAGAIAAGERLPRFTYVVPFASLEARQQAWSTLDADAEWIKMQRESTARYGSGVRTSAKAIYKVAPYSASA